jgi:hypothetical protein
VNEEEEVIDLTRKRKRQDDDEDDEDVEVETRKRKRCAKVSIYLDYYRVISNLLVSRQVFHICNIIVSGTGLREDKPFISFLLDGENYQPPHSVGNMYTWLHMCATLPMHKSVLSISFHSC